MVSPIRKISYEGDYDFMGLADWARPQPAAPNTLKYWWEDANCYEMDPELFEPSLEGRASRKTKLELSEQRMEQARKACSDCPVWHLCYQKAQENDFYYTMRAGIEPGQLTEYRELGRVGARSGQEQERCVNGHNDWAVWGKARPRKKCRQCALDAGARKRQAKRDILDS